MKSRSQEFLFKQKKFQINGFDNQIQIQTDP